MLRHELSQFHFQIAGKERAVQSRGKERERHVSHAICCSIEAQVIAMFTIAVVQQRGTKVFFSLLAAPSGRYDRRNCVGTEGLPQGRVLDVKRAREHGVRGLGVGQEGPVVEHAAEGAIGVEGPGGRVAPRMEVWVVLGVQESLRR